MKGLDGLVLRLVEDRKNIHFVFIPLFLIVFCIPSLIYGLPFSKILNSLLNGMFLMVCLYTGRWGCRTWFLSNAYQNFFAYSFIVTIALILIGILGTSILANNISISISVTIMFFVAIFYFLGVFFSITTSTISKQLTEAKIIQQQKESELQFLKSQLNPHFLFNFLNNLYGISLRRDDRMPSLILKLSNLLRYSLYDSANHFVPIKNELECIENYIEIEKAFIGERLQLDVNILKENSEGVTIAPMLFMVFVENAFKHSNNTEEKNIRIKISFRIVGDGLEFIVTNNMPCKTMPKVQSDNSSGLGLVLAKKRLELLYDNNYVLEISNKMGLYSVNLKLKVR